MCATMKLLKRFIYSRYFPGFAYHVIRLYSATFNLKLLNEDKVFNALASGRTVLLTVWHQQFFSLIRHFKTYAGHSPGLMISQSRDGELIAGVANKTGWYTARGSSSRGGKAALQDMIDHLNAHRFGAHVVDGPTGPMGKVKSGAVKMAHETGAVIFPICVRAENAWYFNSWDRFMLPKPFSKVTVTFGDLLELPKETDANQFARHQLKLETRMRPYLVHAPTERQQQTR